MYEILFAFAMGLAFVGGVLGGAWIMATGLRKHTAKTEARYAEHNKRVEDRLADYVHNTGRIADSLETLAVVGQENLKLAIGRLNR